MGILFSIDEIFDSCDFFDGRLAPWLCSHWFVSVSRGQFIGDMPQSPLRSCFLTICGSQFDYFGFDCIERGRGTTRGKNRQLNQLIRFICSPHIFSLKQKKERQQGLRVSIDPCADVVPTSRRFWLRHVNVSSDGTASTLTTTTRMTGAKKEYIEFYVSQRSALHRLSASWKPEDSATV